jgi:hypothetical protein
MTAEKLAGLLKRHPRAEVLIAKSTSWKKFVDIPNSSNDAFSFGVLEEDGTFIDFTEGDEITGRLVVILWPSE